MNKIKRWLDRRESSLAKSGKVEKISAVDFVRHLEAELGPEKATAFVDLVKSNASFIVSGAAKDMHVLEFVDRYISDKKFSQFAKSELSSNFHRSFLDQSVADLARSMSKLLFVISMSDLTKAVKAKDWSKVSGKEDQDAKLMVEHGLHMKQFPVHQEYSKMLSSSEKLPGHKSNDIEGISAKMLHSVPRPPAESTVYMAKPYHKKLESKTKSWVKNPITGWATMATKALFNAGKIGHLAEDVSAHEHEGVPLTVHKFAADHQPIGKTMHYGARGFSMKGQVDPLQVHQIGVMDYLTNNVDRHHGNLMVNKHTDERGINNLLAIDHERSFQYFKPIWKNNPNERENEFLKKESPWSYIKGSALNLGQRSPNGWYSHEDLVNWWHDNGQDIKDELENQLGSIKDESVRKHVRDNFNERWRKMNDWTTKMKSDQDSTHMYAPSALGEVFEGSRMIKPESYRISSRQLAALPKNKKDALFAIADIVNKKPKLTYKQRQMLSSAVEGVINNMNPEEVADVFKSLVSNPYMATKALRAEPDIDPRNRMLRHFWEMRGYDKDHKPIYKYPHMEEMIKAIDSLPDDKKQVLGSWADSYRSRLEDARKAA